MMKRYGVKGHPSLVFFQFGKNTIMAALKYILGLTFFNNNFLGM
jgi:hypothetical protein